MDEYGGLLGRMACMFIRMIDTDDKDEDMPHGLQCVEREKVIHLKEGLDEGLGDEEMDERFHAMLKAIFFWHESHRLMDKLDCPVQRFLVYVSIKKGGHGFISVREIGRVIAKLLYGIRSCIFMELLEAGHQIDEDLGGLMVYGTEMLQTPFGFLSETMHFAASVAGEGGALPQVSWLGIEVGMALAIHGKRVELRQLQKACSSLLKSAEMQLDGMIKMGMKTLDWKNFDSEDDLTNIKDKYSFISTPNNPVSENKLRLLHAFMANEDI